MKAKRRVVRTSAGFVTMALLTLLVTNARSQDGRARPQVERAAADALEVIDTGFDLSRLEASFIPAQVKPSGLEPESVMPAAPAPERLVSVLVHFEAPNAVRGNAVVAARRQGVKTWAARVGGRVRHEYKNVLPNVINLRDVPESRLRALRAMPGVVEVEEDRTMHAHLTVSTPLIRALQSQITGAGHSADGSGVRVCIIDTGIDMDHVMYASRIDSAASWDFVNNDPNPQDDNGHGSNVAGIAVGGTGISLTRCGVSTTFQGVAPNATLIGVKVLNSQGSGSFSDVIAGIDHCADPGLPGGQADVINLSLGGGSFSGNCDSDSAATAANNAVDAGVVVVSSSGNECRGNAMGTPACGSKVIAVGAVYDDDFPNCEFPSQNGFTWCCDAFCFSTCTDNGPAQDSLTCFSNASNTIDVAAPGCIITSADNAPGGTTVSGVCGTSQASPHVAGLAALILSKDSTLTPAEVRQIIRDGAIDMGPSGFDSGYGWGRVDAINSLDLVSGGCTSDAQCDDGLFCNGAETCDIPSGNCQSGTAPNCNDGVGCTDDSCNEGTNSCDNVANDANCDDGQACNGAETCDAVNDCQAGTPVNCNDGVACTTDTCVEPGGTCSNTPDDAACDDGQFCNGAETCDPALGCQSGTAPNCNDGVGCTDDSCNEATDQCDNVANDANCDDGLFCNGAETCNASLDCQAGADPCAGQSCDEVNDVCVACQFDSDCDDGLFCNGAETCVGGNCQAGTAVNCNDGVACTDDSCNEGTDSCDNIANDANCDDGLFCNGAETCNATLDCQAGTAVNCNDGVGCTDDSCNEATDQCDNVANDANCDDGLFCNGAETCSATLDCQAGTAVNCDDGVACTDDSCNEATNSCDNTANDANCPDDGLFCNGTEFCDAGADCSSTGDPCLAGETCNESTNSCDAAPPTGEGFILSRNPDFSTDDRTFYRNETLYMKVWTDQVDFNDIKKKEWELKDPNKKRVKQQLTNHFDTTYTASFALSGLPSNATDWTWKGKVEDNARRKYNPTDTITVLDAPACSIDSDCDDGDPCTTDVCSGGSCSNTPINCDDGDACTTDSCSGGVCFNDPVSCDDGDACTTDTCDPGSGCSNTPINCDDGDPCTSDSCSGGVCVNDPLPTCCGDTFCDTGEDSCNCPADCGAPPGSETNCTDGIDEDCDGSTDCADPDCSSDPACSTPTGEGYILSLNPDFSTDDRVYTRSDTIYMKLWSDVVDYNDMNRERWELKDPSKNKVRQPLTNHFDGTWTAAYDLSGLPSNATDWRWKGEVKDNAGNSFKPTDAITVLP